MRRSLPLGPALMEAVGFLPRAWAGAWGALAAFGLVLLAPHWLAGKIPAPFDVLLFVLALFVTGVMVQGALYRLGVSPTFEIARRRGLGLGGVQFGRAEGNLLASGVMVIGFLWLVAGAGALVAIFVWTASGAPPMIFPPSQDVPVLISWVTPVLAAAALVQLGVRLCLFKAASVARGKLVSLDAMSLAQGHFWPLLAGLVVVSLPAILLAFACHRPEFTTLPADVRVVVCVVIMTLIQLPLTIGFLCSAYKRVEYWPGD